MTWPAVDLCCSESSEDMSSSSGARSTSALSSSAQQTFRSCAESRVTAAPQLFNDNTKVREDLEYLLLREGQGLQPIDYIPLHSFMSYEHREFLVQFINRVSFSLGLISATLVVGHVLLMLCCKLVRCHCCTALLVIDWCIY